MVTMLKLFFGSREDGKDKVWCEVEGTVPESKKRAVKKGTYQFTRKPVAVDNSKNHYKLRVFLSSLKGKDTDENRPFLYFKRKEGDSGRANFYDKVRALYPTRRRLTQLKKCEDSSPKGRRLTGAELLAQHRQRNPYRDSVVLTRLLEEIKRAQQ